MPSFDIINKSKITESFRNAKVRGMFDVTGVDCSTFKLHVDLPIDKGDWVIGLIVGASGTGKTSIGRQLFKGAAYLTAYRWDNTKSIVDNFASGLGITEIIKALCSVGLSSPPHWLLPFKALSNGEQFRAQLARALLDDREVIIIDEFTSVVDRQVAKFVSSAIAKAVRKRNRKIIFLSCHYDIIDWLCPDWVYNVNSQEFTRGSHRRPEIKFKIFRCHYKAWQIFSRYHYMSRKHNLAATCFIACINAVPVGFASALNFPHPRIKGCFREHRLVVLPDYQGVGIGNTLSEMVAQYYLDKGKRYFSTTSHPAVYKHREKSVLWGLSRFGHVSSGGPKSSLKCNSASRLTASFEYLGVGCA